MQRLYWLTSEVKQRQTNRGEILKRKGINTTFFTGIMDLLEACNKQRVSTIILSDNFPPNIFMENLEQISKSPLLYGIRLILSVEAGSNEVSQASYQYGFRDIIPADLQNKQWINRILFSSSGKNRKIPIPLPNIGLKTVAGVYTPIRIVWLEKGKLKLEARIKAAPGTKLNLVGPLADKMGKKMLSITVLSQENSNLKYRFGDAYICSWKPSTENLNKLKIFLDHLSTLAEKNKVKIFTAIKSSTIRSKLLESLDHPEYIIASALNKNHIITEPKFFGPDLIFIENNLCNKDDLNIFRKMAENLPQKTVIIIIGEIDHLNDLRSVAPGRQLHVLPRVKDNMNYQIFQKYLRSRSNTDLTEDSQLIPHDYPLSHGEIFTSARLTSLNPGAATLLLPLAIGKFGLCRLDSPFIKKMTDLSILSKITDSYELPHAEEDHRYFVEIHFSNLQKNLRNKLAKFMIKSLENQLEGEKNPTQDQSRPIEAELKSSPSAMEIIAPEIVENLTYSTRGILSRIRASGVMKWMFPLITMALFFFLLMKGLEYIEQEYKSKSKSGKVFTNQLEQFKKTKKRRKSGSEGISFSR